MKRLIPSLVLVLVLLELTSATKWHFDESDIDSIARTLLKDEHFNKRETLFERAFLKRQEENMENATTRTYIVFVCYIWM